MEQHNTHNVVAASKDVIGVKARDIANENLGKIEDVMIDKQSGRVAYAVLASGGFLGMGEKFFAIPWHAFHYDTQNDCFVINVDKEKIKNAPGFDKDHWPDMSDKTWGTKVSQYYGTKPYWEA